MQGIRIFVCLAAAGLLLVACGTGQSATPGGGRPAGTPLPASIAASPNPVPAGTGTGTTTLNWTTGDSSDGQVYVSEDGAPENLFAQGPAGSKEASWIRTGSSYEFRLYASTEHSKVLATVTVKRSD